jgi:NAD(P)H-flavin reductase
MEVGDTVEIKGPVGSFRYTGPGAFIFKGKTGNMKRINMIAGGTGITPMYQVITAVLSNPEDTTEVRLLYANRGEKDILLRKVLDALAEAHPKQFSVHHTLSAPGPEWLHSRGYVSLMMLLSHLFQAEPGSITLLCGPPPMVKEACHPSLAQMGFMEGTNVLEF